MGQILHHPFFPPKITLGFPLYIEHGKTERRNDEHTKKKPRQHQINKLRKDKKPKT